MSTLSRWILFAALCASSACVVVHARGRPRHHRHHWPAEVTAPAPTDEVAPTQ